MNQPRLSLLFTSARTSFQSPLVTAINQHFPEPFHTVLWSTDKWEARLLSPYTISKSSSISQTHSTADDLTTHQHHKQSSEAEVTTLSPVDPHVLSRLIIRQTQKETHCWARQRALRIDQMRATELDRIAPCSLQAAVCVCFAGLWQLSVS